MDFSMPIMNLVELALPIVGLKGKVEFPKIIVIGEQSAGKSSVLESIAGFEFLPRNKSMCTRCPIRIEMIKAQDTEYAQIISRNEDKLELNNIKNELSKVMLGLLKGENDVVDEEIHLRIFKKNIVNLTLIDLPGFISNVKEDQPKNLPSKIEKMVEKYAKSESTIILTVVSGHVDPATWKSNKFAKKWDPSGDRTVCVITKVDIDTYGESQIEDLLRGNKYPLKNGYIAVKWRSQDDSDKGITLEQSLKQEKEFFMEAETFIGKYLLISLLPYTLRN